MTQRVLYLVICAAGPASRITRAAVAARPGLDQGGRQHVKTAQGDVAASRYHARGVRLTGEQVREPRPDVDQLDEIGESRADVGRSSPPGPLSRPVLGHGSPRSRQSG